MTCWADVAERQHQRDEEQAEMRQEKIDDIAEALMQPGAIYAPFDYANALDAFDEAPIELQKALFAEIAANPKHPMHTFIHNYWAEFAVADATDAVDNKDD